MCLCVSESRLKKDEEDLITQRERLDQNEAANRRFIRTLSLCGARQPEQITESLSEISICNESIRLGPGKHGWNLK